MISRAAQTDNANGKAATGIEGLDVILRGGFPRSRLYLVEGQPGTGKTTLGLRFLLEGRNNGENTLYFTLSETTHELHETAKSHGWDLDGIVIHELVGGDAFSPADQYTVFEPSEVELGETIKKVFELIEEHKPSRVVFDSLSEMRLLAHSGLRYRRQILALKCFLVGRGCTVLLLDDRTASPGDEHVMSVAHGVLQLENTPVDFGVDRRRIRIAKLRAIDFHSGFHDFKIVRGGLEVYPRLVASQYTHENSTRRILSGIEQLDTMLAGGLQRGTSTLILGPAGAGKSSLVSQYANALAKGGEKVAIYVFEESLSMYSERARHLGMEMFEENNSNMIMRRINPAELSPGEFICSVRHAVLHHNAQLIVIDSLNGFLNAMAGERQLLLQMHELLSFLHHRGVTSLMTESQHGMMGVGMTNAIDVSYLADTVILLRYFEAFGAVKQAISVIKNRAGGHERYIREFRLGPGVQLGEPLHEFQGILTGVPDYIGEKSPLLAETDGSAGS